MLENFDPIVWYFLQMYSQHRYTAYNDGDTYSTLPPSPRCLPVVLSARSVKKSSKVVAVFAMQTTLPL